MASFWKFAASTIANTIKDPGGSVFTLGKNILNGIRSLREQTGGSSTTQVEPPDNGLADHAEGPVRTAVPAPSRPELRAAQGAPPRPTSRAPKMPAKAGKITYAELDLKNSAYQNVVIGKPTYVNLKTQYASIQHQKADEEPTHMSLKEIWAALKVLKAQEEKGSPSLDSASQIQGEPTADAMTFSDAAQGNKVQAKDLPHFSKDAPSANPNALYAKVSKPKGPGK